MGSDRFTVIPRYERFQAEHPLSDRFMWAAIAGLLAFLMGLFGLFAYLLSLALNSHFRSEAAKRPNSISFWYVKTFDAFLNNTFFKQLHERPKRPSVSTPSAEVRETYIQNLHSVVGTEDMIDIRQSFSVSVDLTTRLPHFLLNTVAQPATLSAASFVVGVLFAAAISIVVWNATGNPFASVGALYLFIPFAGLLWFALSRPGSFFREMQKLYYRRYLVLNIDDRVVYSESGWGRYFHQLSDDFRFVHVSNEFSLGIGVTRSRNGGVVELLTFHRFLEHLIMDENGLQILCKRLNRLVEQARALPKIKYEEVQI